VLARAGSTVLAPSQAPHIRLSTSTKVVHNCKCMTMASFSSSYLFRSLFLSLFLSLSFFSLLSFSLFLFSPSFSQLLYLIDIHTRLATLLHGCPPEYYAPIWPPYCSVSSPHDFSALLTSSPLNQPCPSGKFSNSP